MKSQAVCLGSKFFMGEAALSALHAGIPVHVFVDNEPQEEEEDLSV